MAGCGTSSRVIRFIRVAASIGLAATALVSASNSAQAHHIRHLRHHVAVASYEPAFSAIVIDANTGRELYGVNENGLRHPASITKVMTLYLLFEQLDKGVVTMQSQIPISEHAASQEPSKLGIAAGDSISVEDAIKAVVTRSANDVAVAIGESIGGDETTFAQMMTRKAHALGMAHTIYRNCSGLPNDEQVTTARDLSILGRALQDRFPKYFHYFSTHEFAYDGEIIGNHNHLLGRIDGVDGIKTGYTRASGFNLLTSLHRDGRSLVAVVMGGRSAPARDNIMASLIEQHLAEASNRGRTAPMIAESEPTSAPVAPVRPLQTAAARIPTPPRSLAANDSGEGDNSADDEETAKPAATSRATLPPARIVDRVSPATALAAPKALAQPEPVRVASASPQALGWVKGAEPVTKPAPNARPEAIKDETRIARSDEEKLAPRGSWVIQVGATDDAGKANDLLIRAKAQTRGALASAKPFTEKFRKGEDTFYRARFAGLAPDAAEQACRSLKRSGFACFATRAD